MWDWKLELKARWRLLDERMRPWWWAFALLALITIG